jgi:peptidoglycan/xylan/chitin deacetylase (PgdA/CDA1 family)
MYHDIVAAGAEDASGFPGRDAALYKVTPARFDAHLDAIRQALPDPERQLDLVLSFDDGGVSALRTADALETRGLAGHFFITVNYIGTRGFATRSDIVELRRRGHSIGSHSCSHPLRMGHCAWPHLVDEWKRSRAALGDILGEDVSVASVPGGDFAPRVAEAAARAGYVKLFTSEPTGTPQYGYGLTLVGRFTIQRWTAARTAAALAAGEWLPCTRQAIVWSAKKIAKRLTSEHYLQLRRILLGHKNEVQWGDRRAPLRDGKHRLERVVIGQSPGAGHDLGGERQRGQAGVGEPIVQLHRR